MTNYYRKVVILVVYSLLFFSACSQHEETPAVLTITGKSQLGPLQNAEVRFYLLTETGQQGILIGTTTTSSAGSYLIALPEVASHLSLLVTVTGGSYREESTGMSVSLGTRKLEAVISSPANNRVASITPLTHMAAERALKSARSGKTLDEAISDANYAVAKAAGISDIADITTVVPADPAHTLSEQGYDANSVEAKYALFLAGISERAQKLGIDSGELAYAFAKDFLADGKLDGQGETGSVKLSNSDTLDSGAWDSLAADQAEFISDHGSLGYSSTSISIPNSEPPLVFDGTSPNGSPKFFTVTGAAASSTVVDPAIDGYFRITVEAQSADYRGTIRLIDSVGGGTEQYTDVFPVGSGTPNQIATFSYTFTAEDNGVKSFDINFLAAGTHTIQIVDTSYTTLSGSFSLPVAVGAPYSFEVVPNSYFGETGVCQRLSLNIADYGGNAATTLGALQFATSTEIKDEYMNAIPGGEAFYYTSASDCENGINAVTSLSLGSGKGGADLVFWTKTATAGYSVITLDVTSDAHGSITTSGYTSAYAIIFVE